MNQLFKLLIFIRIYGAEREVLRWCRSFSENIEEVDFLWKYNNVNARY